MHIESFMVMFAILLLSWLVEKLNKKLRGDVTLVANLVFAVSSTIFYMLKWSDKKMPEDCFNRCWGKIMGIGSELQ